MPVHIGEIIKAKSKEKNLSLEKLGKLINTTKQNVGDIYKRKSIDTDLLLKLCEVLQYNFFEHYYDEEPLKSMRDQQLTDLKNHIDQLNEINIQQQDKITDLNKIISANEELITFFREERALYKKETGEKSF